MPLRKRGRRVAHRLSEGVKKEIGFRRKIKTLRDDPDLLATTIEEEGLELAEGSEEILKGNNPTNLGTIERKSTNKRKRKLEREADPSDDSVEDELEVFNHLSSRVKTIDKDAQGTDKRRLVKVEFQSQSDALLSRLNDIKVVSTFMDNLVMISTKASDLTDEEVDDEIKREKYFFRLAKEAFIVGSKLCHKNKIPLMRPPDYYAEMIKNDEHMHKVRERLVQDATSIEAAERARKQRISAKFGKKLQAERLLEIAKKKSKTLKTLESAKKRGVLQKVLENDLDEEGVANGGKASTGMLKKTRDIIKKSRKFSKPSYGKHKRQQKHKASSKRRRRHR